MTQYLPLDGVNWAASLTGERTEVYGVDVLNADETPALDPTGAPLVLPYDAADGGGIRAGLTGGKVTLNLDARVQTGCTLNMIGASALIDWMSARLRPWVQVNGMRWNLGIFLASSPDDVHDVDAVRQDVTLLDKTSILDADELDTPLSLPVGEQVVPWVQQIILDSSGESLTAIVPSDKTLSAALTWPAGTSKLDVVNQLLDSIAYNALWCDREGQWRSEPWIDPADQVPSIVFAEGAAAIHSARIVVSQNNTGVPNKVICIVQGDDSNPGLIAVATNTDPTSPYSYARRGGRWIPKTYDNLEASDQATLERIAARNLKLNSTPPWYASVQHAVVPLDGRQVLQLTSGDIDRQVTVNEYEITMTPGELMTGKWKAVAA